MAILLMCGCDVNITLHCPSQTYVPAQNPGSSTGKAFEGFSFIMPLAADKDISRKDQEPPLQTRMVLPTFNSRMLFHMDVATYVSQALATELTFRGGEVIVVDDRTLSQAAKDPAQQEHTYRINISILEFDALLGVDSLRQFWKEGGANITRHIKLLVKVTDITSGNQIMSEVFEDHMVTHHMGLGKGCQDDVCLVLGNYMLPLMLNKTIEKIQLSIDSKGRLNES